ncbi:MAG: cellulose synthase catalytic subunit [Rickettsiales bacterium]|nr:cellulose synthase catalytic subunit [Rickettsiales bacterium]
MSYDILQENLNLKTSSYQIFERFEKRKIFIRTTAILYLIIYSLYLIWRVTILNENYIIFSSLYFIAEIMGFILGASIIFSSWKYNHNKPKQAPEGLSVDVFVPTYKEPLEIIRRTIIAAKNIKYPHQTFLLDDGKRDEVQKLAEELDIIYIRRDDNKNAKAGNLNNGFMHSNAEFIMVLDADHIAMPHALDVTLGFFTEPKVAMVQTPQDYYNIDAFQYINSQKNNAIWHDQSFFYSISQPCRDSFNGASCVGTGVIYRRSALDKIAVIPTDTVTEDIHTSLKLHKAGYKIVNLNESIAYGIAASDLEEYYKTRRRWAHGNLHALALENILLCKELSLKQKISYLTLGIIYLEGWQQLLLFIIPIGALIFGLQPFEISVFNIMIVLLFPIINYLFLQEIGSGFSRFWVNEIFAMARWPIHLISTIGVFGAKLKWRSSKKNLKGKINLGLMMPQLILLAVNIFAIIYSIIKLTKDFNYGPVAKYFLSYINPEKFQHSELDIYKSFGEGYTIELFAIAGFWALFNCIKVIVFTIKVIKDSKNTHKFFRFDIPAPIIINGDKNNFRITKKISEDWIEFYDSNPKKYSHSEIIEIKLFMPFGEIIFSAKIENIEKNSISASIIWGSNDDRDILANSLYSIDWHREFLNRNKFFTTPLEFLKSILSFKFLSKSEEKNWNAALINFDKNNLKYAVIKEITKDEFYIICFENLPLGKTINLEIFLADSSNKKTLSVCTEEGFSCLSTKGLDNVEAKKYRLKKLY